MNDNSRILVTSADGFIGLHLTEELEPIRNPLSGSHNVSVDSSRAVATDEQYIFS